MIKYLFLLFSSLSIAIFNFFDPQDVAITHNIPDYLVAGKTYDIDVVINKGNIEGFAKFQMEMPDGINVLAVETRNSSFTFKSNMVKNIWMKVPSEPEIILSYKFEVAANLSGSGTIDARFVFIKDNERFSVEMEKHEVRIGDESSIPASSARAGVPAFNPDDIKLTRMIKSLANNEFEVSIIIEKDGLEGFAKVQEELPEGFEARPMRTSKSVFSVVENKVKFIWFNIPPEETIEVSYLLSSRFPVTPETLLKGSFNFLYNDEARQIDLPSERLINFVDKSAAVIMAPEEPADETSGSGNEIREPEVKTATGAGVVAGATVATAASQQAAKKEEIVEEAETVDKAETLVQEANRMEENQVTEAAPEEVVEEIIEQEKPEEKVKEEVIVEEITAAPVPRGDIFYRVQLVAGHNNVSTAYLKKKYKFNSEIYLENHEGWFKYTTGQYQVYVDARNRREAIKSAYKFPGPFVTAYNAGERITVQEALLISKQKWVK